MKNAGRPTGVNHPLVELTSARLREFVREPEALFWALVFPIIMSVGLAVAFPSRGDSPVLVGLEPGPGVEAARGALVAAGVTVRDLPASDQERALREGEVHLVLLPTTPPAYRYDPLRPESRLARLVVDNALKRAAGRVDPWEAVDQRLQIPGSRYVDWLVPGIVGMNIMGTGLWGMGFSIVQARMRKLLKRLAASPMRRRDYLLAQVLARLLFLAPEVTVPVAFAVLVLGMPVRGSMISLAIVSVVGALAFGGLALLVSSRARTFEAISGMLNLIMLPMWVLSGVFFASSNFPDPLQPFIQALPLTALIDALRAVILDGATVGGVRAELLLLTFWGVVPFAIALRVFKWR
jgi:ABC-type multidrug transport system permease subunit